MLGNGSAAKGAAGQIVTSSIDDNLFILGFNFSWEDWLLYAADETKIFVFDSSLCTCAQLVFKPLLFAANAGPAPIDIYTNVSYDIGTGTLLQTSNRRETSSNTPDAILRHGTTGFSGSRFAGDLIPANGTATPNAAGNVSPQSDRFEIDITKNHAFSVHNTDGAGVYIQHKITWFEVPAGF